MALSRCRHCAGQVGVVVRVMFGELLSLAMASEMVVSLVGIA
jgi:hypothetical protein